MASTERVRTRAQRVASRIEYEGFTQRCKRMILEDNGLKKLGLILLTAFLITAISGAWDPPLRFRLFSVPDRDVVCNTPFSAVNAWQTSENKSLALKRTPHYYANDLSKLDSYKQTMRQELRAILGIVDLRRARNDEHRILRQYLPAHPTFEDEARALKKLQEYFEEDVDLANFSSILDKTFAPFEQYGVLKTLHSVNSGNQEVIKVYNVGPSANRSAEPPAQEDPTHNAALQAKTDSQAQQAVPHSDGKHLAVDIDRKLHAVLVRTPEALFGNGLVVKNQLNTLFNHDHELVDLFFERIRKSPPETLTEDLVNTKYAQLEEMGKVGDVRQYFVVGDPIVHANDRISMNEYDWLKAERRSYLKSRPAIARVIRFTSTFALNFLLLLSCYFILTRRRLMQGVNQYRMTFKREVAFLALLVVFFLIGRLFQLIWPNPGFMIELVPIVILVELTTFATTWSVALTVGVLLSFMLTMSGAGGMEMFTTLCGVAIFVAFLARSVRTRLQLVFLAFDAGCFAFFLSIAAELIVNDYMRPDPETNGWGFLLDDLRYAVVISLYHALWGFMGGVFTTCLLPMVELYFHVVTPMQLLEYANPSHPLMIELNQRAPATYNHSIQTSTLAEAAAEAIGARSYLVKVGAYFHDVGKMMNPEYFTENQSGYNIHNDLEPRMSALVIVAHVKDGVNLAQKYRIPREIIDLIEQHHGTMLVSFFYRNALKAAQEQDPDARLDEAPFRYPGPIPQTKEAGILMLADAVESASRSLSDWSPRRVESLVRKITDMRIEDGQFQESGLSFGEIKTIQQSLVTSLLASRHSRVQYPDQPKASNEPKESKEPKETRDESKGEKGSDKSSYVAGDDSALSDSSSIIRMHT